MVKKISNFIFIILISLIIMIEVILLYSTYVEKENPADFLGISLLKVISGSMSPIIEVDDYIIIYKTNVYKVGDIITYKDNNNSLVTHRIIDIKENEIITKGDFNSTVDVPISKEQVVGVCIINLHPISNIINFIITPIGFLNIVLIFAFVNILKRIYVKRNSFVNKKDILVALGITSIIICEATYAKFGDKIDNIISVETANMVVNTSGETHKNTILKGSDIEQIFSVENYNEYKVTEVAYDYYIYVIDGDNNILTNAKIYKNVPIQTYNVINKIDNNNYEELQIQTEGEYKDSFYGGEFFLDKKTEQYKLVIENIQSSQVRIKVVGVQKNVS